MRLWILRPIDKQGPTLWEPWYDKSFGFVVRAENEEQARRLASMSAGDEGSEAWLQEQYSTCAELLCEGMGGVVIRDFARA